MNAQIEQRGRLQQIVDELSALRGCLSESAIVDILEHTPLAADDVAAFVAPTQRGYGRRRIVRCEDYEVLLMTWLPGQRTGAHDHAGALSVFKIIEGTAHETRFAAARDSLVDSTRSCDLRAGEVGVDAGDVIHEIRNADPDIMLISLHVYAPPLPELRRFVVREASRTVHASFRNRRVDSAVVAIIGGGFSGSMVLAQLARHCTASTRPLHAVVVDRQTSLAEGAAYRTPDSAHLLNVPAAGMSAWPDRPNDFLNWAARCESTVSSYSFQQRRAYGEYLRATLFEALAGCGSQVSVEHRRQEALSIDALPDGRWRVATDAGSPIEADTVVLATGHRPPDDPLAHAWSGSPARYVADPWAALALTSIEPQDSVCLLGTGLTTLDVVQTLSQTLRIAPVWAISRRGLVPAVHATAPLGAIDAAPWLDGLLEAGPVAITSLARQVRAQIRRAEAAGQDWRQVIDGLRPHITRLWQSLGDADRGRFLRHLRPFWEVSRHRMAPSVAANLARMADDGLLLSAAARPVAGHGESDGVTLTLRYRGQPTEERLKFAWVVNCTGPGAGVHRMPPLLGKLVQEKFLESDRFGLGVRATASGHAWAQGRAVDNLFVIGTLRKPDLWESTAVPELRQQAAAVAEAILQAI